MAKAVSNNTYAQAGLEEELKKFWEDKFSSIHRLSPKSQMDGLRTFPFSSFLPKIRGYVFRNVKPWLAGKF